MDAGGIEIKKKKNFWIRDKGHFITLSNSSSQSLIISLYWFSESQFPQNHMMRSGRAHTQLHYKRSSWGQKSPRLHKGLQNPSNLCLGGRFIFMTANSIQSFSSKAIHYASIIEKIVPKKRTFLRHEETQENYGKLSTNKFLTLETCPVVT